MGEQVQRTPAPWRVGQEYVGGVPLYIGDMHFATVYRAKGTDAHANARRIVAAVNACEGIPTEAPEAGVVREMAEELKRCRDVVDADAVLAKLRGDANAT